MPIFRAEKNRYCEKITTYGDISFDKDTDTFETEIVFVVFFVSLIFFIDEIVTHLEGNYKPLSA